VDKGACNEIRQGGFRGCSALTCSWWPAEHKTHGAGAGTRGGAQGYSTIAVIMSSSAITEMRQRGRAISFASSTRDASGERAQAVAELIRGAASG
jgi:lipid-binding SYLF domain-containing protein